MVTSLLFLLLVEIWPAAASPPVTSPQAGADAVWEQVIAAKGGRQRLMEVRSIVLQARSRWRWRWMRVVNARYEELLVLPGQFWSWSDERPSPFGVQLLVADVGRGWWDHVTGNPGILIKAPAGPPSIGIRQTIRDLQAVLLMETRSQRPQLVGYGTERLGSRRVRTIEARVEEQSFRFFLDDKTNLPMRVLVTTDLSDGNVFEEVYELTDYRDYAGLKLPHQVKSYDVVSGPGTAFTRQIDYLVNVDYDPTIFRRPPSLERGAQGWQRTPEKE